MTSTKLKILVFLESDIVIRHFVNSGALKTLCETHDVRFVFPPTGYQRIRSTLEQLDLAAPFEQVEIPDTRRKLWHQRYLVDNLRWKPGADFRELRRTFRRIVKWKAAIQLSLYGIPGIHGLYMFKTAKDMQAYPAKDFADLIKREEPDLLVHPSTFDGYFINDFIDQGKKQNIPTVLIMNSWDNPSVKRATSGKADWVIVWGQQTMNHTERFMDIPKERIIKLGAAQFSVYQNPPRISRDDFCQEHQIDPQRKILLYAGSSKLTNEFEHLVALDEAAANGTIEDCTIVYRPHPWGMGGHNGARIVDHQWEHVVIEASMQEYMDKIKSGDKAPYMADYARTHDVLSSIDALVSPLSTIILEGALHGKPVMCYLPPEDKGTQSWLGSVRKMVHFEDMYNSPFISMATNEGELVNKAQQLLTLSDDEDYKRSLLEAMKFFVETPTPNYPTALVATLESLAA